MERPRRQGGGILRIPFGILLIGAWLFWSARAHPEIGLAGLALAIGVAWIFRRTHPREDRAADSPSTKRPILARIAIWIRFLPFFAWLAIRAGLNVAQLALSPSSDFWPGIVRIKGGLPHRTATTLFAHLITLTPGTLTLDYDETEDDLYIHWIDVADYAGDNLDREVSGGMRPWIRRMFE